MIESWLSVGLVFLEPRKPYVRYACKDELHRYLHCRSVCITDRIPSPHMDRTVQ